jgi:hypothetical protein
LKFPVPCSTFSFFAQKSSGFFLFIHFIEGVHLVARRPVADPDWRASARIGSQADSDALQSMFKFDIRNSLFLFDIHFAGSAMICNS